VSSAESEVEPGGRGDDELEPADDPVAQAAPSDEVPPADDPAQVESALELKEPARLSSPSWLDAVSTTAIHAVQGAMETAVGGMARLIDHGALGLMRRAFRAPGRHGVRVPDDARERLLRLAQVYGRAEHFVDPATFFAAPEPARVEQQGVGELDHAEVVDLTYPSRYVPHLEVHREAFTSEKNRDNLIARARHFRLPATLAAGGPRPTVICIHGWGGGAFWLEQLTFPVRYFVRLGLDVVLWQLPYHGQRSPGGKRSGAMFPSWNVVHTNEAFGQAIHDLRALVDWLLARGAPAVGALGMSLGGYTTALLAATEPRLAFAVPMIPVSQLADLMWETGKGTRARALAVEAGVTRELLSDAFAVHTPLRRPPLVPKEGRLIVAGLHDRITPPAQAQRLWHHWGQPAIHWFDGGHLLQANRRPAFRTFRDMLRDLSLIR
jgi:pimeloyl-ACP methyl ester carboxylesterase